MKSIKRSIVQIASLCTAMLMTVAMSGCSADKNVSDSGEAAKGDIAVIVKSKQAPEYWDVVNNGAKDAGAEIGYNIVLDAPATESDVSDQIKMIDDAVSAKCKAIVISPINTNDLNDSIKKATDAGVTVVTIDSRCSLDNVVYIGTDNRAAGNVAGREAKAYLDGTRNVAIVALAEGSDVSDQRADGFAEVIQTEEGVTIVETTYCNADRNTAKAQALELIEKYPDLELIYGVNQTSTLGICDAVAEKGLADKIDVIGIDSSEEEIEFLSTGVLDGAVIQNPYNMGYLGVRNAAKLIDGENVSLTVDTGVTFVNKDNLNNDEIQLLLYPLGKED